MRTGDLTKKELVETLEIIEAAHRCVGRGELKRLLIRSAALVEADNSVCGVVKVSPAGPTEVKSVLNGSYPEKMFDHYLASRLYIKDPVTRYHANFSTTSFWSDIFREVDDEAARQVVGYASDFGLRHGISSSLFIPEMEGVAIISFAGREQRFGTRHKTIADILGRHLISALRRVSSGVQVVPEREGAALAPSGMFLES